MQDGRRLFSTSQLSQHDTQLITEWVDRAARRSVRLGVNDDIPAPIPFEIPHEILLGGVGYGTPFDRQCDVRSWGVMQTVFITYPIGITDPNDSGSCRCNPLVRDSTLFTDGSVCLLTG